MYCLKSSLLYFTLLLLVNIHLAQGKNKKVKSKKVSLTSIKGLQCYNCLSYDHPGCWDPDHPDYANVTVPSIDCNIPGINFLCIVITSESAKLLDSGREIGPVRARTCVPANDFNKKTVTYTMCNRLSKELSSSEIFSRISVSRPSCTLCKKHLCTDADHC